MNVIREILLPLQKGNKNPFNMDTAAIIELVSSLGFPIVICFVLINHMTNERKDHKEETDKLRQTIEDNSKVLTELTTLIKTLVK